MTFTSFEKERDVSTELLMWNKEGMKDHFPDMDDSDWTKEYSKIIKKAVKVLNSFYYKDLYLFLNILSPNDDYLCDKSESP